MVGRSAERQVEMEASVRQTEGQSRKLEIAVR